MVASPPRYEFASRPSLDSLDDHYQWHTPAFNHDRPDLRLERELILRHHAQSLRPRILDNGKDTDGRFLRARDYFVDSIHKRDGTTAEALRTGSRRRAKFR